MAPSKVDKVFSNSIFAILDQVLTLSGAVLLSIILARYLGADALGRYTMAITMASLVTCFCNFGTQTTVKRKVAERVNSTRPYFITGLLVRLAVSLPLALLVTVVIVFFARSLDYGITTQSLATSYVFFTSIILLSVGTLTSLHRNDIVLLLNVGYKFLGVLVAWGVLHFGAEVDGLLLGLLILSILFSLLANAQVFAFSPPKKMRAYFRGKTARILVLTSLPLTFAALSEYASLKLDTLLIGMYLDPEAVGLYSVTFNIILAGALLPLALTKVYFPNFINLLGPRQTDVAYRFLLRYSLFFLLYSLLSVVFLSLVFEPVILFLYGDEFVGAVEVGGVLVFSLPFIVLNRLFNYTLVAVRLGGVFLRVTLLGLGLNISLNMWLIPEQGLDGAAIATVCSEALVMFLGFYKVRGRLCGTGEDAVKPG